MSSTTTSTVPIGVPALLGIAGLSAVVAVGGQAWQLIVSALLALTLIAVDLHRGRLRRQE